MRPRCRAQSQTLWLTSAASFLKRTRRAYGAPSRYAAAACCPCRHLAMSTVDEVAVAGGGSDRGNPPVIHGTLRTKKLYRSGTITSTSFSLSLASGTRARGVARGVAVGVADSGQCCEDLIGAQMRRERAPARSTTAAQTQHTTGCRLRPTTHEAHPQWTVCARLFNPGVRASPYRST